MAAMTLAKRQEVWAQMMRDLSTAAEPCATLKADLQAAINAADQWCEDNAASFNAALPAAARTGPNALTTAQKARLLAAVALKRFGG